MGTADSTYFVVFTLAGLNHEHNMRKMRLLTFMQMAETRKEMDFHLIQEELVLGPQAVEEFVIDGGCQGSLPDQCCLPRVPTILEEL